MNIMYFILGLALGALLVVQGVVYTNNSYYFYKDIADSMEEACQSLNSVPVEGNIDGKVVCKNGAVINYNKK